VPPNDRGLLARLDALVALAADRHGLALLPDGRLAAAEARVAARAAGLARRPRTRPASDGLPPGRRGLAVVERDAVELLRAVAEGVGLLRVRGDRLEATSLRHAWTKIDEGLRAGLVYAAWCQQVTLTGRYTCPTLCGGAGGARGLGGGVRDMGQAPADDLGKVGALEAGGQRGAGGGDILAFQPLCEARKDRRGALDGLGV
jgi:hypothetical protein